MANWPCTNSSCNSYGKPHPNCKCAAPMAHGGFADFCSDNRMHTPGCEYFAEGGLVENLAGADPYHAVAGHYANSGLFGLLKMGADKDLDKYHKSVKRGHKAIASEVDNAFDGTKPQKEDRSKYHEYIEKWLDNGGIDNDVQNEIYKQNSPEMMAEGGSVGHPPSGVFHGHPVEHAYPEQNILLQSTKGKISNYLKSLKPQTVFPKLAFDDNPDQTSIKKVYKGALKIADHPLSVLHEASKGTIVPEHILHLNHMYPELYTAMQKKITEKILHAQLEGKKPNSKIRQSLSLLMGANLSGVMEPQNIIAAQSAFAGGQPQQQQPAASPGNKKGTSSLSKSDQSYLTGQQALSARQQRPN